MTYTSIEIGGIQHEWDDFKTMIEYYKGHPNDRWIWIINK
jgi:hypothetical protein